MLGNLTSSLVFPHLKYIGHTVFNNDISKTERSLYYLDWTIKDQKCEEKHNKWLRDHWKDKNIPLSPSLPEKYEVWVKNLQFAIPPDYMEEIIRNSREGLQEWNIQRCFDTNVREFCLKPAIAHIYSAFYLMSDCIYDPKTNYYIRGTDKIMAQHLLTYRFWMHQTGRGCVWDHAFMDDLRSKNGYEIVDCIEQFEKENEKYYADMSITENLQSPK